MPRLRESGKNRADFNLYPDCFEDYSEAVRKRNFPIRFDSLRMEINMSKSLIAWYSRKGSNYFDGKIMDLPVGNTEVIAKKIAALTGSELFHIEAVKPYPADYDESTEVAKIELGENARPELTASVPDFDAYDVIYLGYPIWWGVMPMPVLTVLESYNFSGKTIAPFCTHEGSGLGMSERYIRQACPQATVLPGLAIIGHLREKADQSLKDWLKKMGLAKQG